MGLKKIFWWIPVGITLCALLGCEGGIASPKDTMDHIEEENPSIKDDRIVVYEQEIKDYYQKQYREDDIPIELVLEGTIGYEDEQILIVHFDEILEFGSWHYTNSALFFMKQNSQLARVKVAPSKNKLLTDFYQREMQYPNRIEGKLHQRFDLTGDGIDEYIFYARGSVRTNIEDAYQVYQLDTQTYELSPMNLSTKGNFVEGECEIIYGMQEELKVLERDSSLVLPMVELKKLESVCTDTTGKVNTIKMDYEYYQWNDSEKDFLRVDQIINQL